MANIWIHVSLVALCLAFTVMAQTHSNSACLDDNKDCPKWALSGECYHNAGFMFVHCPRTCGQCGYNDPNCHNANFMCAGWAKAGECRRNKPYMAKTCARACGFCVPAKDHSVPHIRPNVVTRFWDNWSVGTKAHPNNV
ncbi:putative tyrosinase-like protein tyr-3 [Hyalella azteca]|uniref:Tyrosinase-like protein tyr-3 n=1 Tax=Hyalella azteca TaxID=294128 RepID=A0A8B7PF77_HYAAZ|nr:putative tyrosinase-like protein tyr-3 [Hyalella azteca]